MKTKNLIIILAVFISSCGTAISQTFEGSNLSSLAPSYENLPYVFEGSENYFISFKTEPEIVDQLVPEPLKQVISGEMMLVFAKHNVVSPSKISYHEAYLMATVNFGYLYASYLPVLYLDKMETITPAREIWGYNKVNAVIRFDKTGSRVKIYVSQSDTLIMQATFMLGRPVEQAEEPTTEVNVVNHKYIPAVAADTTAAVNQLTVTALSEYVTTNLRSGEATLEFYPTQYNPLDKIPVLEILDAGYFESSFKMDFGEKLHDYLTGE